MVATRPPRRTGRAVATAAATATATAVATVLGYAAWLGWDTEKTLADGHLTGPYEPWQVLGLAVSIGLIAAAGGWFGHPGATAAAATVALTVAWSYQASQGEEPNLWPIGATALALGTAAGTLIAAAIGHHLGRRPAADTDAGAALANRG